jgi:pimeloyl-ACP methyl ester carboxylesterase
MLRWFVAVSVLHCLVSAPATAQKGAQPKFAPPKAAPPGDDVLKEIEAKTKKLEQAVQSLKKQGVRDPELADVEIHARAARMIVTHGEWFNKDSGAWTLEVLDRGLTRARLLAQGEAPWTTVVGQTLVRGYRSRVDESVQPYAVALPASYGQEAKRWRIDVVLHGRNSTLTEPSFIRGFADKPAADAHFIRIDVLGRGNNAYRWAGETDVFEAIQSFLANERLVGRDRFLDTNKIVLRGFSMGGAGSWHIGLHHPDRWCVVGPGAGFTTTYGYAPVKDLPAYQDACLKIYDAVDYAPNAVMVPLVAYSGEIDAQKLAADNIENALKKLGIPMTHIVAPGLAHSFPPEWVKRVDVHWSKFADKGKPEYPETVDFTTYTLKYPNCFWIRLLALEKHYDKTHVKATLREDGYDVRTTNVRQLQITLREGATQEQVVTIDGHKLVVRPTLLASGVAQIYLKKTASGWESALPQRILTDRARHPQKIPGLQGPIDDAFTDAFLCVRGRGTPWNDGMQKYANADLDRFAREWSKYFRGDLPIKDDVDVSAEDIAQKHLILFGDPGSNSLIKHVLDGLPLTWTKDAIELCGAKYAAKDHVPALIYPNPLNAQRYVVINSGHTFHEPEYKGTNALLFPRLGDYAILKRTGKTDLDTEVATAGLFDEYWQPRSK